jgi:hypothetical protein
MKSRLERLLEERTKSCIKRIYQPVMSTTNEQRLVYLRNTRLSILCYEHATTSSRERFSIRLSPRVRGDAAFVILVQIRAIRGVDQRRGLVLTDLGAPFQSVQSHCVVCHHVYAFERIDLAVVTGGNQ